MLLTPGAALFEQYNAYAIAMAARIAVRARCEMTRQRAQRTRQQTVEIRRQTERLTSRPSFHRVGYFKQQLAVNG